MRPTGEWKARVHVAFLDSMRFSSERHSKADIDAAEYTAVEMVKLAIALFGEVSLPAHELIDVDLVRTGALSTFVASGSIKIFGWERTFRETLAYHLRRRGMNAAVFGSVPMSIASARDWSSISEGLAESTDAQVLRIAADFTPYAGVLAAVEDLDRQGIAIWPTVNGVPELDTLMGDASSLNLAIGNFPRVPVSYSNAHHLAAGLVESGSLTDINALLQPFDIATRLRYALQTGASLLMDTSALGEEAFDWGDFAIVRALTRDGAPCVTVNRERYARLVTFRRRLASVSAESFLDILTDPAIAEARQAAWRFIGEGELKRGESLLNTVLENLAQLLPAPAQEPAVGQYSLFGFSAPASALRDLRSRLHVWRDRKAIHEIVTIEPPP